MTDTPSNHDKDHDKAREVTAGPTTSDSRFGDTPEQALAATSGEGHAEPNNRVQGLGGGYGGQGGGDSGNVLTGTAEGIAGGATGNPTGVYDFPEMQQARAIAEAAAQPALEQARAQPREQAGGDTPAKE